MSEYLPLKLAGAGVILVGGSFAVGEIIEGNHTPPNEASVVVDVAYDLPGEESSVLLALRHMEDNSTAGEIAERLDELDEAYEGSIDFGQVAAAERQIEDADTNSGFLRGGESIRANAGNLLKLVGVTVGGLALLSAVAVGGSRDYRRILGKRRTQPS